MTPTLEARAIASFGTVDDLRAASFVLPDGTMISWPGGGSPIRTRASPSHHSDLARALAVEQGDATELVYGSLAPLLAAGWLRVQNFRELLVTEIGRPITAAQAAQLRAGTEPFDKVVMEAEYGAWERPHCEASPPTPSAVNACVRELNAAIIEGSARHEALLERMRRDHPELLAHAQRGHPRRRRLRRSRRA
jgi:hypothetical protein